MLTPGHPAKDWWGQATEGERVYNLPSKLAPFTTPVPGSGVSGGLHGRIALGAASTADPAQVQLLAQLDTQVWAELTAAQDMLQQVAKYDPGLEAAFVVELQTFFTVTNTLEGKINMMTVPAVLGEVTAFEGDIVVLSDDVRNFKMRVNSALRGGVEAGQLRIAVFAVLAGAAAMGVGWYVFRQSVRKGGR